MLLGWSRAILLQLAHPMVATGVAEHSTFRDGPVAAARRLHGTTRAMLSLTFGAPDRREAALEGIRAIHRRVNGRVRETIGRFPEGTPYSAEDPALLLWVHSTLLDSILLAYEQLVRPLSEAERDAYCTEASATAIALGANPSQVPTSRLALTGYLERMYDSGLLAVSPEGRSLASAVISPSIGLPGTVWAHRLLSVGWLPPAIRAQYGLAWEAADDRRLRRLVLAIHTARRWLPLPLAWWPEARP